MTGPGRSDGSSPTRSRPNWTDLGPRTASAAVLIVITVVALWIGGYVFAAVVGAVFAGAYREWETMVTLAPLTPFGVVLIGVVAIAALLFPSLGPLATLGGVAAGAVAAMVAGGEAAPWRAVGLMFFGLVMVAALALRGTGSEGALACVYLGTVIWTTDAGAFFTGRQVGGERLAPSISPGKTRSGAIGGLCAGIFFGTVLWLVMTDSPWWIGVILSAVLSVLGQVGDLSESALKRRFRIKDSGDIIPGHGGLMDRLDSLTLGALFLALVGVLHAGSGSIASGALFW